MTTSMAQQIYNDAFTSNRYGLANAEAMVFFVIIFVVTVLTYGGLRMFGESYVLWTNGNTPNNIGITIVLYIYKTAFARYETGYAAAMSTMLFVVLFFINLIYIRLLRIGKEG